MRCREQLTCAEAAAFTFGRTLGAALKLKLVDREKTEDLTMRATRLVTAMAAHRSDLEAATRRFHEGVDAGVDGVESGRITASDVVAELARLQLRVLV